MSANVEFHGRVPVTTCQAEHLFCARCDKVTKHMPIVTTETRLMCMGCNPHSDVAFCPNCHAVEDEPCKPGCPGPSAK